MEIWSMLILTIVTGIVGVFYVLYRRANYFKNNGLPYIPALPFLGNMEPFAFNKLSLPETTQKLYNMKSDLKYFGILDFLNPVVVIRDPELINSVAIKNFASFQNHTPFVDANIEPFFGRNLTFLQGDEWREMRNILTPTYTASKMKMMYEIVAQCGQELVDYFIAEASQPFELEMKEIFTRHTNDVIASAAFGVSVNSLKDRENAFYATAKKATTFGNFFFLKLVVTKCIPFLSKLFGIRLFGKEVAKFFNQVISSTVAIRDKRGIVRKDLLQAMIQSRDTGKKELTTEEMTAHAFIVFLGGFDTSSTLMTWTSYSLATNPTVQEKLQAEIDAVLAEGQGNLTYEALQGMRYLDMVISETLRLYPPFIVNDRMCTSTFELPPAAPGHAPAIVQVGTTIWFPSYAMHRDPKYFPNPEKFDPERFSEENKRNISPLTYYPFGIGPRSCIGNRFALMQAKVALFYLLSKCQLSPCSKTSIPPKLDKRQLGINQENGCWLNVQRRS